MFDRRAEGCRNICKKIPFLGYRRCEAIPQIAIGCPFWLGSQRDLAAQATIIISESRPLLGLERFQRCFR